MFTETDTFNALPLANRFAALLLQTIGASKMKDVVLRNKHNPPGICASHDFCDANDVMDEAFVITMGREPVLSVGEDTEDSLLWNTAWGIAKYNNFNQK